MAESMKPGTWIINDDGSVGRSGISGPHISLQQWYGLKPMPATETMTIEVLKNQIRAHVKSIFDDWEDLRRYVYHHRYVLKKRWTKKTPDQRTKLLLEAFGPGLPKTHRPDISALVNKVPGLDQRLEASQFDLMLPNINLEDLIQLRPFLLLLDARARHNPSVFAPSDNDYMRIGLRHGAFEMVSVKGVLVQLFGQHSRETYGCLVNIADASSVFLTASHVGLHPGEGMLVLKAQAQLMAFLAKGCRLILHDYHLEDLVLVSEESQPMFEETDHTSLATERLEAPYRAPEAFDYEGLLRLANAKCAELQDHLWLLREDPSYFRECLLETSGVEMSVLAWTKKTPNPVLETREHWTEVITYMVRTAYIHLWSWAGMRDDLQDLQEHGLRYLNEIPAGQPLPKAYTNAITCLLFRFTDKLCSFSHQLSPYIAGADAFRHRFVFEEKEDGLWVHGAHYDPTDRLWWLLRNLCKNETIDDGFVSFFLDEIERLCVTNQKERYRMSPILARHVSEFSVVTELKRQLAQIGPGGRFIPTMSPAEAGIAVGLRQKPMLQIRNLLSRDMGVVEFGLTINNMYYPVEKKRTITTMTQMRDAERFLDDFWDKVDKHFLKHTGKILHQQDALRHIIEPREVKRTQLWIEAGPPKALQSHKADDPFNALKELEQRTEHTIDNITDEVTKVKVKTRGTCEEETDATASTDNPANVMSNVTQVLVSKRGLETFSTMFQIQDEGRIVKESPWNDFLRAMSSAGFAIRKLDGSIWMFEMHEGTPRKSILIHEPHPDSKISPTRSRRIARRLERAFGWTADSFVRDKGSAGEDPAAKAKV